MRLVQESHAALVFAAVFLADLLWQHARRGRERWRRGRRKRLGRVLLPQVVPLAPTDRPPTFRACDIVGLLHVRHSAVDTAKARKEAKEWITVAKRGGGGPKAREGREGEGSEIPQNVVGSTTLTL